MSDNDRQRRGSVKIRPKYGDDSGFSMLEVVVAMAVFTVLATISLGILANTDNVAGDNVRRTAAANLVNQTLETARSQSAQNITDGRVVTTQTVGGTTYTITQNANYVSSNSTTSVCTGSGNTLAYKLVSVAVSWPNMGNVKPVRGDILRAVGVGSDGLDATTGTLAVSLLGSTGQSTSGVQVTVSPGGLSRTTGDDGCAVFTGLTPGTYTASANSIGYVGTVNTQAASVSNLSVTAGHVSRGSLLYDSNRSVNYVFDAPATAAVPPGLPIRFGDSYVPEATLPTCIASSTSACGTAVPGTVKNLFPESYTLKAGSCTEATPSQTSVDLRSTTANGTSITIPVGTVTVKVAVSALPTIGITGRTVSLIHAAQTVGCTSGETYTTPSVATGSTLLLPYGTWTVSVPILDTHLVQVGLATQSITLDPTNKTATVLVLVAA
jgi:prepilin-type N-terminal cleavage/methylation domain-containing protein